jgi:hypothetical protein
MKKILYLLFSLLITASGQIFGQESAEYVIIAAADVNMRDKPLVNGQLITKLQLGQIGKVLQRSDEPVDISVPAQSKDFTINNNYWYKIRVNGQTGWVYGAFAFELVKAADFMPPANWGDGKSGPAWYGNKEYSSLSIYNAITGTNLEMGNRISFLVLINDMEVNEKSTAILLEGDATTENFGNTKYRNMIAVSGGMFSEFSAGYDGKEKIVIYIKQMGLCMFCGSMTILEGTYQPTKRSYLFTQKYGTSLH